MMTFLFFSTLCLCLVIDLIANSFSKKLQLNQTNIFCKHFNLKFFTVNQKHD